MKNNDWLTFTRRERSGILLLLLLSAGGWMLPSFYERLYPPPAVHWEVAVPAPAAAADTAEAVRSSLFAFDPNRASPADLVRLGLSSRTAATIIRYREKGGRFRKPRDLQRIYNLPAADYRRLAPYIRIEPVAASPKAATTAESLPAPFPFDPNTISLDSLRQLGLPPQVAQTLINYRRAGGVFRRPGDLGKVYGMTTPHLERLLPYVELPAPPADSAGSRWAAPDSLPAFPAPDPPTVVDINRADAAAWAQLPGIGPVLSDRIIRFRERLGGFVAITQVAETYGLADSVFQAIRPRLRYSPPFRRLAINDADWETLSAHPYLNRRQARALVAYRQAHGPFSGPEALAPVRALPPEIRQRLLPYLSFELSPAGRMLEK